MTTPLFHLTERGGPLILSAPHPGRGLPAALAARLTGEGLAQIDADHSVDQLYDFAGDLDATVLTASMSRYVVDLNRPPDNQPLYPGQFGSGLVPVETFDGKPLYRAGDAPTPQEVAERIDTWWRPYHTILADLIAERRRRHGYCLLWDCHSIAPVAPRLFDGRLPDLNLGSFDGQACPVDLAAAVLAAAPDDAPYSRVLDGRFKGGYITRHYGQPTLKVFALQLELTQSTYLAGEPTGATAPEIDPGKHDRLRPVLRAMLAAFTQEAIRHV